MKPIIWAIADKLLKLRDTIAYLSLNEA